MRLGPLAEDVGMPLFIFETRFDRGALRFHHSFECIHIAGELRGERLQFFGDLFVHAFLVSPWREKNRTQWASNHEKANENFDSFLVPEFCGLHTFQAGRTMMAPRALASSKSFNRAVSESGGALFQSPITQR